MTPFHAQLGRLPNGYTVHGTPNDWQVAIDGPAGPAVITRMVDGSYEVETSFPGLGTRLHLGLTSPTAAMDMLIAVNDRRLIILGVAPPPAVGIRTVVLTAAKIAAVLAVLAAVTLAAVFLFSGNRDGDANPPAPSVTHGPVVLTAARGDGKYTGAQCEAQRMVALSNSPEAADAAAEYDLHCKARTILDSPAPTLETTR